MKFVLELQRGVDLPLAYVLVFEGGNVGGRGGTSKESKRSTDSAMSLLLLLLFLVFFFCTPTLNRSIVLEL